MTERKLDPVTEDLVDRVTLLTKEVAELRGIVTIQNSAFQLALLALEAHISRVERQLAEVVRNAPRARS